MDGYVTIGTNLDTKTFDKEIEILKNKLNDIEATLQMASEDKTLFSTSEIKEMDVLQPGVSSTSYIKGVIECDGEYVLVVMPSKFISADDFSDISKMVSDNIWNNNNSNNVSKA